MECVVGTHHEFETWLRIKSFVQVEMDRWGSARSLSLSFGGKTVDILNIQKTKRRGAFVVKFLHFNNSQGGNASCR